MSCYQPISFMGIVSTKSLPTCISIRTRNAVEKCDLYILKHPKRQLKVWTNARMVMVCKTRPQNMFHGYFESSIETCHSWVVSVKTTMHASYYHSSSLVFGAIIYTQCHYIHLICEANPDQTPVHCQIIHDRQLISVPPAGQVVKMVSWTHKGLEKKKGNVLQSAGLKWC